MPDAARSGILLYHFWVHLMSMLFALGIEKFVAHGDGYAYFFAVWFVFRYFRLVVNIFAYLRVSPYLPALKPRYDSSEVTIVVPTTFSSPQHVLETIGRALNCRPGYLLVVTENTMVNSVRQHCNKAGLFDVSIIGVPNLNKRVQMLKALREIHTPITVFIDDDVFLPNDRFLAHLLAPFEDVAVGAVGPQQRVRRSAAVNLWNILGIGYLERRNFNTGATNYIDGGVSTLSGRCQAVRTDILKGPVFEDYFRNDTFAGKPLMVDDDKCVTRYIYSNGHKIILNLSEDCTIETVQEEGFKYIDQCIRWARAHWRGNIIVMHKESYWLYLHHWTYVSTYVGQFHTPALLYDGISALLFWPSIMSYSSAAQTNAWYTFLAFVLLSKIVKIIPHFVRHPQDLIYLPVCILFSYLHGIINLYALITTGTTVWGNKEVAQANQKKEDITIALDQPHTCNTTQFREYVGPSRAAPGAVDVNATNIATDVKINIVNMNGQAAGLVQSN